ncbi:hypothetical protein KC316_g8002 [Hortaea werneckii]|nr:hypothetical protein KC334_g9502 [Hortaea werneckii]KAI7195626.1 hypothetical protein KC324_g4637 [Hortaea werneckii]KAI7582213.1 hypothetical protein KC316_g8002 [Hortaea werneckii]
MAGRTLDTSHTETSRRHRNATDYEGKTKATPPQGLKLHLTNLRDASLNPFSKRAIAEITPVAQLTEEIHQQPNYVLHSSQEPTLLQRTFQTPLTNARLGTQIGTTKSALYEFVFPQQNYSMVRLHAKPWQTAADLPHHILRFPGKPVRGGAATKQYRYEPFIILRKVRAAEGPVGATRNEFAVECTGQILGQAGEVVGMMVKGVNRGRGTRDHSGPNEETTRQGQRRGDSQAAAAGGDDTSSFSYAGSNSEADAELSRCSDAEKRVRLAEKVVRRTGEFLEAVGKEEEEGEFLGELRREVEGLRGRVEGLSSDGR